MDEELLALQMADVVVRYLGVSIMDVDHHPRAAIDNERGAQRLVASSISLALRQNALESSVLHLHHHVLG